MRKLPWLVAFAVPAAAVVALSLPALGEGREAGEGACASAPAGTATAGPIDLDKIAVKPVAGPLAISGAGNCDDDGFIGKVTAGLRAMEHEGRGERGEGIADD